MNHNMSRKKCVRDVGISHTRSECVVLPFSHFFGKIITKAVFTVMLMMICVVHTVRTAHKQPIRCKTNIRSTTDKTAFEMWRHRACRSAASRRRRWGKFDAVRHAVELTESLRQSSLFVSQISEMNTEYEICEQTTSSASLTVADSIHGFEFQWRIHFLFEKKILKTQNVARRI